MLDASSCCTIHNWIQRKQVLFRNSNKVLVHKSVKDLFCKESTIATFRRHFERHLLQCMMSAGGTGSLQRRGEGGGSQNGSPKRFSEMVLRNGSQNVSQKGQMGLQRHRWQQRQRIKKGQAGPLKHSLSMKWENKETKQFWFDAFAKACLILGELYHILGELYFPHLEIRSGGNDSRLILITIVPPDYHPFPGYSAPPTDSLQS